jgi:hypothetical protein
VVYSVKSVANRVISYSRLSAMDIMEQYICMCSYSAVRYLRFQCEDPRIIVVESDGMGSDATPRVKHVM